MKPRIVLLALVAAFITCLATLATAQEKFSLSMFHFNIQYVAGGLKGFPSGTDPNPAMDLDDAETQDLIIRESFEPILDLFLAHPQWKVTLEMQAYMVEVMQDRHPGVLSKLKQLVDRGQVELVSFHYSDQLFLAYPKLDLERSHQLMEEVWVQAGFSPSGVVFCQEGQFGQGMASFAKAHGRNILVLPRNLFKYQHFSDSNSTPPLYTKDGVDVILGAQGISTPEVVVTWSFFGDGELLATDELSPYAGSNLFKKSPAALARYEQELTNAEADGFHIATITEFVEWAKQQGLDQPPLPPMLDGTWQPQSSNSMRQWMGVSGVWDFVYDCERDNQVLTGNVRARHWNLVAEILVDYADQQGRINKDRYSARLLDCWREVSLAEVSDATGLHPFINEVRYGLDHAAAAQACAELVVLEVAPRIGGPYLEVNTATGTVVKLDDWPSEAGVPAEPFFTESDGFEVIAPGRTVEVSWKKFGVGLLLHRVEITVSKPQAAERNLEVVFPLDLQGFYLTSGLLENDAIFYPFSDFDLEEGRISLPVANGLLGIGTELWLIKQTSIVHIAATFIQGDGRVRFIDDTLDPEGEDRWIFWVVEGSEQEALDFAHQLNLYPVAHLPAGNGTSRGCGCGQATGDPLWALLMVAWLYFRRWKKPFLASATSR